jgi:hypothetical protein
MSEPTAATHVFVGMFRPKWETVPEEQWNPRLYCPHGHILTDTVYVDHGGSECSIRKKCWEDGCFDTPVYVTIEEALKKVVAANPECLMRLVGLAGDVHYSDGQAELAEGIAEVARGDYVKSAKSHKEWMKRMYGEGPPKESP